MGIEMVRAPSEKPNIRNTDDFMSLRYAYSDKDGYVDGHRPQFTVYNDSIFSLYNGIIVIQGIEVRLDGVRFDFDDVLGLRYAVVYCQVDLLNNTAKVLCKTAQDSYPEIDKGDDLAISSTGTANLALYRFRVQDNVIIDDPELLIKKIPYNYNGIVEKKYDDSGNVTLYNLNTGCYILQKKEFPKLITSFQNLNADGFEDNDLITIAEIPSLAYGTFEIECKMYKDNFDGGCSIFFKVRRLEQAEFLVDCNFESSDIRLSKVRFVRKNNTLYGAFCQIRRSGNGTVSYITNTAEHDITLQIVSIFETFEQDSGL